MPAFEDVEFVSDWSSSEAFAVEFEDSVSESSEDAVELEFEELVESLESESESESREPPELWEASVAELESNSAGEPEPPEKLSESESCLGARKLRTAAERELEPSERKAWHSREKTNSAIRNVANLIVVSSR